LLKQIACRAGSALLAVAALGPAAVSAQWLAPGDVRLRHELQLLADAGVVGVPVTGWPLDISTLEPLEHAEVPADLVTAAQRSAAFMAPTPRWNLSVGSVDTPYALRNFAQMPREQGELRGALAARRGRLAYTLQVTHVQDPSDGADWRGDGSYVGAALGNWFLAIGANDRWWGPGWEGSLLLSSNARPIPAVTLQRRRAEPFDVPVLKWLGPWTMQTLIGQLEQDRDVPHAQLFGLRFGFKPTSALEIGLLRTAQWCGEGRPCGFSTFLNMLSGLRDNRGQNVSAAEEPGNQLAGFDLRYAFTLARHPGAFYAQRIGEDELHGLPSAWLSLFGLETWGELGTQGASFRLHAEWAETTCGTNHFGCAYEHSIYTTGYRYQGRPIGHTMDSDGVMASLGGFLVNGAGNTWQLLLRRAEINRGNRPRNTLSLRKQKLLNLELSHTRYFARSMLSLGFAYDDGEYADDGSNFTDTRAFVNWQLRAR
jgi:Capsule assembly protein Wzi